MRSGVERIASQILAIAIVTFQELLRERVLWSAAVFAAFAFLLSYLVSDLTFIDNARIALSFGLTSTSLVGALLAILLGANLIAREIRNRTLYLILTKSIWRWQFIVGKYLGLVALLLANLTLMTAASQVIFLISGGTVKVQMLQSFLLQGSELAVLAAIATMFSVFTSPILAAVFTGGIWLIGHAMPDLLLLAGKIEPAIIGRVIRFLARVLPDLSRFDVKAQVLHHFEIHWGFTAVMLLYATAYAAFAVGSSCVIFGRRDL